MTPLQLFRQREAAKLADRLLCCRLLCAWEGSAGCWWYQRWQGRSCRLHGARLAAEARRLRQSLCQQGAGTKLKRPGEVDYRL
jgi:hypothetical protein